MPLIDVWKLEARLAFSTRDNSRRLLLGWPRHSVQIDSQYGSDPSGPSRELCFKVRNDRESLIKINICTLFLKYCYTCSISSIEWVKG